MGEVPRGGVPLQRQRLLLQLQLLMLMLLLGLMLMLMMLRRRASGDGGRNDGSVRAVALHGRNKALVQAPDGMRHVT